MCAVRLLQGGRLMLSATVTAGPLPDDEPRWAEPVLRPAEPTDDAVDPSPPDRPAPGLAGACELRYPPEANPFARGETGPPRMRGWVRPRGEEPDALFALLAGDVLPPTVFNLGGPVRLGADRPAHRAAARTPGAGLAARGLGEPLGGRRVVRRGRVRRRLRRAAGLPGPAAGAGAEGLRL